jgi:ribosomal protein S18 acetylase RimI-like enzyme
MSEVPARDVPHRDVRVRRARPAEYDAVGELTIVAYRTLPVDHLWGGYEAGIRDVAGRADSTHVLVAVDADADELLGAVTYADDPTSGWLEWTEPGEAQFRLLAVAPAARGRGVGDALARACCERARADGRRVLIHTTQWMEAAQRLYARLGFTRTPARDVAYREWLGAGVADLPDEWVGVPFLAYRWP